MSKAEETETPAEPLFFVRPKSADAAEDLVKSIASGVIKQINADRLARGLPPIAKSRVGNEGESERASSDPGAPRIEAKPEAAALAAAAHPGFAELEAMLHDPAKLAAFKAEAFAKSRVENPHLTEAQLEAHWEVMLATFF